MTPDELKEGLREQALTLGFDRLGVTLPELPAHCRQRFVEWVAAGRHGGLQFLARRARQEILPEDLLPGVRRVVVLAASYDCGQDVPAPPANGQFSRYARVRDYHRVLGSRVRRLAAWVEAQGGMARGFVDTSPLSERSYAVAAGLGRIGRNSLLLVPELGSWVFLALLLTTLELPADRALTGDPCGDCRRCIEACPTQTIGDDRRIAAGRCLACLTIERRGVIPEALRPALGNRVFGCDVCQEVCPQNRNARTTNLADFRALRIPAEGIPLAELLALRDEAQFRDRFAGTPVMRAKRLGFLRSVSVAIGNSGPTNLATGLGELDAVVDDAAFRSQAAWSRARLQASALPPKTSPAEM